jgi:hypothetical protein
MNINDLKRGVIKGFAWQLDEPEDEMELSMYVELVTEISKANDIVELTSNLLKLGFGEDEIPHIFAKASDQI